VETKSSFASKDLLREKRKELFIDETFLILIPNKLIVFEALDLVVVFNLS